MHETNMRNMKKKSIKQNTKAVKTKRLNKLELGFLLDTLTDGNNRNTMLGTMSKMLFGFSTSSFTLFTHIIHHNNNNYENEW